MVGTGFAVAAVCYFASNTVLATSDGLTPSLTLNEAFQTFDEFTKDENISATISSLKNSMARTGLQQIADYIRAYSTKVRSAIALQCKIFTPYKKVIDLPFADLSDEERFVMFKDAVYDMHARMETLKTFPEYGYGEDCKKKLVQMNMATNTDEFSLEFAPENLRKCYTALMEGTEELKNLKRQFVDYLTERDAIFSKPGEEDAAALPPMPTPPSTTEPASTESTSTNPAVPNAQDSSAAGGESTGTPSTPAPATGETTAPTEQQTQETTSNTSGSSASTTTGTTEQQAQQDAPQGENLKPAPTGSSASFNGLAVAVLSVLVVSSM
ncbi:merozoite surface antigen-1, putative [Babesia ovis]|uniref:Merozoite surface antigen-1, putative n=1 Tax=Babesia ovis TaxID=5869 RepID=A0A9W5TCG9_BABOV|nr:merozoite surface antigen-1, putative [Babesia ovis]